MTQHYRPHHSNSDSLCGENMVGRRTEHDMNRKITTCIRCVAILEGRDLYAVYTVDEDGYHDVNVFRTALEQIAFAESCMENGAELATMRILSPSDLEDGE